MCFTTCWQERVKKRGELFTSRSLKNIITSVRWEQLSRTGPKVFVVIVVVVVVVCFAVWTALCFFACLGESAPASATGRVCECLRTGKRGKTRTKEETHSTGFGFQHLFESLALQTRSDFLYPLA